MTDFLAASSGRAQGTPAKFSQSRRLSPDHHLKMSSRPRRGSPNNDRSLKLAGITSYFHPGLCHQNVTFPDLVLRVHGVRNSRFGANLAAKADHDRREAPL